MEAKSQDIPARTRRQSAVGGLLLVLTSVIISAIAAEGALQVFNYPPTSAGWDWTDSPYRTPASQQGEINQLGLRGRMINYSENDFVIVLVGDSQVEVGVQSFEDLPEILLEQALNEAFGLDNIKVFSLASAGWGQDQQLISLDRYFSSYRANLVLVWLSPGNDYWENAFVDRSVTEDAGRLKPTFSLTIDGKLEQAFPPVASLKLKELVQFALGGIVPEKISTREKTVLDWWMSRLPSPRLSAIPPHECPSTELDQQQMFHPRNTTGTRFTVLTQEAIEHSRSHFSPFLVNLSSRDEYLIRITHALLEEMDRLSTENGAQFLMFYPYRPDMDGVLTHVDCIKSISSGKHFLFDGSDMLRHLHKSTLIERTIAFKIRADEPLAISDVDPHLNRIGNTKVMSELTKTLVQKGVIRLEAPAPR